MDIRKWFFVGDQCLPLPVDSDLFPRHGIDGLSGEEGTFNICTFWLVEALSRAGRDDPQRLQDARLMFEQMLGHANHLGLYAEEIGFHGEALGNFPLALTHLGLQGMLARKKGRVLNIASTAGFQPGPDMAIYYATKAFVLMFSEGIAEEVRDAGVTVTAHCPGATLTNFGDTAGNAKSILFRLGAAPADKVARHAYRSMMKGKVVAIEGLMNWLSAFSVRFSPRVLVRKITRWLNQTP